MFQFGVDIIDFRLFFNLGFMFDIGCLDRQIEAIVITFGFMNSLEIGKILCLVNLVGLKIKVLCKVG